MSNAKNIGLYDSLDADTIQSYQEYQLASLIFYGLKENGTSEQSSRMSAMDNASKNAGNICQPYLIFNKNFIDLLLNLYCFFFKGEMIGKLTLYYNRTRQAVITRELIEIISGAAALDSKE